LQNLKQQLLAMVTIVQFQTTFQTTTQTSSIINTLYTETSYLRQKNQVMQDIRTSHVIHKEENVRIHNITIIPTHANVLASTS